MVEGISVVLVPYVDAMTVLRVLLFVLQVCMLIKCERAKVTAMLVWGDGGSVVVVSAGHIGGTRGSGIVSSSADELEMSVVRGMRGFCGLCEMCMCWTRVCVCVAVVLVVYVGNG